MSLLSWLKPSTSKSSSHVPESETSESEPPENDNNLMNKVKKTDSDSDSDSNVSDKSYSDDNDFNEPKTKIIKVVLPNENDKPSCWTLEMTNKKTQEYKWLMVRNQKLGCASCKKAKKIGKPLQKQGVQISDEWVNCAISQFGKTEKEQRQSLRKKIFNHKTSEAHKISEEILAKSKEENLKNLMYKQDSENFQSTERIFRTVYNIIKKSRPFTDLRYDVDLQVLNGINMGRILHSDHACADIARHIANEMRKTVVAKVIANDSKLAILIDESTSVSNHSVLVICIKAFVGNQNEDKNMQLLELDSEILTFFLDFIELENTTALNIMNRLMLCLENHGFTNEYLLRNLVCFASDGASNMIGAKSGVATLLLNKYPNIITWHCSNHRLELAVGDVVEEVCGINHFKIFFEKLYSLYNASPKNQNELKLCASELNLQLLSIGKILNVRWVASSLRSVKAVWKNYQALFGHFQEASCDTKRQNSDKSKFIGLKERLTETNFVHNLGLLFDALNELSFLSLEIQKRNNTVSNAHRLIQREIRVLESMIERPGSYFEQATKAVSELKFQNVDLHIGRRVQAINEKQFFRSLAENLRSRLLRFSASHVSQTSSSISDDYNKLIHLLDVLDKDCWPQNVDIRYGEDEITELCQRFKVSSEESVRGFRQYIENQNVVPVKLCPLFKAVKTLVVSTAECERIFSAMNNVHSDLRNKLKTDTVSALVFIKCIGPPLDLYNPKNDVKSWIMAGRRNADFTGCPKPQRCTEPTSDYAVIWKYLNHC